MSNETTNTPAVAAFLVLAGAGALLASLVYYLLAI